MSKVTKRDGKIVDYNIEFIENAIAKALVATQEVRTSLISRTARTVAVNVESALIEKYGTEDFQAGVEEIQDLVEKELMNQGYQDTAKAYILYRDNHEKLRNQEKAKFDVAHYIEQFIGMNAKGEYLDKDWRTKENSTVGVTLGGLILSNSGTMTSNYWLNQIYDKDIKDAHDNCFIHIHDLSMLSAYCFTGDTRIMTPDGKNPSFEELVESGVDEIDVIAYDKQRGRFVKTKGINPRITREVNKLVVLTFKSGSVTCTSDHLFMNENGTFVKAEDLKKGDRVKTVNSGNREYIYDGKQWLFFGCEFEEDPKSIDADTLIKEIDDYNKAINESKLAERDEDPDIKKERSENLIKWIQEYINSFGSITGVMTFMGSVDVGDDETVDQAVEKYYLSIGKDPAVGDVIIANEKSEKLIDKDEISYCDPKNVYDLTVPEYENFALWNGIIVHNCSGWNLKQLIQEGLGGVEGKITSAPAKHLSTLCNQMVNFLGILQNEAAGAQAFSSFDTYLAPFVKVDNLSYKETKQAIQSFLYGVNTPSRWGTQAPFTNVTIDWTVPEDLADLPAIVGGEEMNFCYKDCQKEMDMINKAFIELMIEGDYNGRGYQYPISKRTKIGHFRTI